MDSLQSTYKDEEPPSNTNHLNSPTPPTAMEIDDARKHSQPPTLHATQPTPNGAIPPPKEDAVKQPEDFFVSASESLSESEHNPKTEDEEDVVEEEDDDEEEADEEGDEELEEENRHPSKKHKPLSSLTQQPKKEEPEPETALPPPQNDTTANNGHNENNVPKEEKPQTPVKAPATTSSKKKSKSKKKTTNSVWVSRSTRKGKKKAKPNPQNAPAEDKVLITPVPRFFDKSDDAPEMSICLSKVYKAEKVELSEDRLSAGSTKGYRMVRATRGVCEGAWYYEIKVVRLGETGHTRLGWSTEKGDLQAPVGYDGNSFGYRDVDGSKVHKALREKYGEEGYKEGDVVGFYINLPEGGLFAPKPPQLVWYKGQRYHCSQDPKEDPPKIVPGSEISFFKNGVCQGVAFKDLYGGCYFPAASMYTLPNQPNCEVKFNFGPDFEFFPGDFGGRPVPRPMIEVSYHGYDSRVENGASDEKK